MSVSAMSDDAAERLLSERDGAFNLKLSQTALANNPFDHETYCSLINYFARDQSYNDLVSTVRKRHQYAKSELDDFKKVVIYLYQTGGFEVIGKLYVNIPDLFIQDAALSYYALASFSKRNELHAAACMIDRLCRDGADNSAILSSLMRNQRSIRNSAAFFRLIVSYYCATYAIDDDAISWRRIYTKLLGLSRRGSGKSVATTTSLLYRGAQHSGESWEGFRARFRIGEEFQLFAETTRLIAGLGDRFKLRFEPTATHPAFVNSVTNIPEIKAHLTEITKQGPTIVLLLHSAFNHIVFKTFAENVADPIVIGRSLYKRENEDDGFLTFQDDKASRLAVFAKTYKHLAQKRGAVMLAPDGATGSKPLYANLYGNPLRTFSGTAFLAHGSKAQCHLMYPVFTASGITMRITRLNIPETKMSLADYEAIWLAKFGQAAEESLSDRASAPALSAGMMGLGR